MGHSSRCNHWKFPGWKYELFSRAVCPEPMDQKNRNESTTHRIQIWALSRNIILAADYRRSYYDCFRNLPLTHPSHPSVYDCGKVLALPGFGFEFSVYELNSGFLLNRALILRCFRSNVCRNSVFKSYAFSYSLNILASFLE